MIKTITCTECPNGCQVTIELNGGEILNISGNLCLKGKFYAENEIIAPRRVLTSTVKTADGRVLPVKTDLPILKENIFSVMKKVNTITVTTPIEIGEIVFKNIDENINLIATTKLV